MSNPLKKMKLPIWLKMFAKTEFPEDARELDSEVVAKIARALEKKKSVVMLLHGKPIKIEADNDDSLNIQKIEHPRYVFE